jgi:O-antigen/teichoic acid export membrane protein
MVRFLFKNAVDYERYKPWILLMVLVALFSFMLTNYLYTSEQINIVRRYSIYRIIFINAVSLLALLYFRNDDAIAIRFIVISCVEIVLLLFFYRYYLKPAVPVFDATLITRSLKMGLPMMISAMFSMVIAFGDKFFLEKYVDYKGLSIYYLAFSCASVIPLLSNSLQNVWLPLFLKEKELEKNVARTRKLVKNLVLILTLLSVVVMAGVAVSLALHIIPATYTQALYVLPLLLLGQIILCLTLIYYNYLVYFEKTNIVLVTGLVISVISVLLNMLLIPVWKIYGAAVTSLISTTLNLAIYYFAVQVYKKRHQMSQPAD